MGSMPAEKQKTVQLAIDQIDRQFGKGSIMKLTASISKSMTAVIFINQIRMKIGVMFGNPETMPGRMALKLYSSVRLDIRKIGSIKDGTFSLRSEETYSGEAIESAI